MHNFIIDSFEQVMLHKVGNKLNDEPLILSELPLDLTERLAELLKSFFLKAFDKASFYALYHTNELAQNEIYAYATAIFENPDSIKEKSQALARFLYDSAKHPNIKGGELYVVYFQNVNFDGQATSAIGLFKSEQKDTFLKIKQKEQEFELEADMGINIQKLDKGCIIFNVEAESGYQLAVIDQTNKGEEARYWMDDFLGVMELQDEDFKTRQVIALCKNFITKEMPTHFEVSKADQADMLNRSAKYLKENDNFSFNDFSDEVLAQPDLAERFARYKEDFQQNREIELEDQFVISEHVVKQQAKVFKSVIKLDKNFHIYVHGNRNLLEQGTDENGRKFYKLYYDQES